MPHAPLRIFNVPFVAGDDVNMDMQNALSGRWSDIDADIVAIRIELLVDEFFFLFNEVHAGRHFFRHQVEKAGDMSTGDDQGVPGTCWVGVTGAESKFMLYRYPTRIFAKQAWIIGVSFLFLCCFRRQQNTSFCTLYFDYNFTNEETILASNKGRAYFALLGYHFNPDDITRLLGIEPTSVNAAGAHSGLDKPVISSWELSTETLSGELDVFALTDIIVKQLEPIKEKIVEVCKSHNLSPRLGVTLTLSVDKGESSPDVGFSARTIRFLADTGSFIEVENKLSERI
jgi:hypothetical protein